MNKKHHQPESVANRVAEQIAAEHLQPRSATSIWTERLGYLSLVVVALTGAVLLINWVGFQLRATGVLDFLQYGTEGYQAVLEALPYGFLLLSVVGLAAALVAIRHFDISYHRPLTVLAGVLVVSIGLGTILAVSGVNEELAEQADNDDIPHTVVHQLYRGRLTINHQSTRLIIGPVVDQQPKRLRVAVPPERLVDIATNEETQYPTGKPVVGDQVRILIIRDGNFPLARVVLLKPLNRPQTFTQ